MKVCIYTGIVGRGHARRYFGVGNKTWTEFKTK